MIRMCNRGRPDTVEHAEKMIQFLKENRLDDLIDGEDEEYKNVYMLYTFKQTILRLNDNRLKY